MHGTTIQRTDGASPRERMSVLPNPMLDEVEMKQVAKVMGAASAFTTHLVGAGSDNRATHSATYLYYA